MDHRTRELVDADRVLSEHYTAAVGAKAQCYEPMIADTDMAPEEAIMRPNKSKERAAFSAIDALLRQVPSGVRRTIWLVYAHGTDALSDATDDTGRALAGRPTGLVEGPRNARDTLGLLRVALSPSWGHGSYVRLAVGQPRTLRAFGKRYADRSPTLDAVLDYLAGEAGKGAEATSFLAAVRNECEEARSASLRAFSAILAPAMASARQAREAAKESEVAAARACAERARTLRRRPRVIEGLDSLHEMALARLAELEAAS